MPYEPRAIHVPRVAGFSLRALTAAAESGAGGALRNNLVRQAGIDALRGAVVDEAPLALPAVPRPASAPEVRGLRSPFSPPKSDGANPEFETIADFTNAYRQGTATPEDVARKVLAATEHSESLSPPMRFFIAQHGDDVVGMAQASSRRYADGRALGPLDGVPIAVKDEVNQVPYPTTAGTRLPNQPASVDSTVVARLRAAGAVLIGKSNMHEIGIGVTGINPHHGAVRNPYAPARMTGGSSSGSAAVVAAGLCPAAVGADGGGSIRIPAAMCGVVGLKPTFGRISESGAVPLCWSLAHLGPIAGTVKDAAALYSVMAGRDDQDPLTWAQPEPRWDTLDEPISGLKIGVYRPWFEHADADVVAACQTGLDTLREKGAQVVEITVEDLELVRLAHLVTIASEMASSQEQAFKAHRGLYGHDVRLSFALVRALSSTDYVKAQRVRRRATDHLRHNFMRVDVLATPTTATSAPVIAADALASGESNLGLLDRIMRFAVLANLTGFPAISFPVGYTPAGLPVGLQLMGRPWEEHVLLQLAHTAEQSCSRVIPQVHYTLL